MKVAIAGAGAVGRSIARELLVNAHEVTLFERNAGHIDTDSVVGAGWVLADACELANLEEAQLQTYDVMIAATGDDKANLVVSLLAKTEFAVNRVVARVTSGCSARTGGSTSPSRPRACSPPWSRRRCPSAIWSG